MSVKYGILTLLYSQKNHGYELKLELESLLGTKGKINAGQIYTTLDRLIRDQLVLSVGMDDQERKLYEITAEGKKELENWMLEPVPYHSTKDDFHFKWSCARKVGFEQEKEMLEQQKAMIMKNVMELTKLKTDFLLQGDENRYLLITGTLLHLEADLNWIHQVENRNQS
ncbi:PadR family transcriptional regulator [Oceanobacillus oncorhynchi subsp. incaldanensis]|uniref:Lineage-specific thermal regulator protein n=2 Tax=Oceanobacillus TaxID=182709 RepID=A0A0A1M8X1_9BACI|nr:PadR family transcriptional regulator [Oceanobacillus oncorhynchi]MDM8102703.1 PadR family transcriptional regulator [Oceanobacillus oncorhynchi]GIO20623.1 PadR family transcriptional regulator [Oceanobacillus oncorhynchi subsp. incaldanensis]CEI81765.1 lineage-specific thermal regulator protein [Oceanobacillus oncorhynchi]